MPRFIQLWLLVSLATQATSFTTPSHLIRQEARAVNHPNALFMAGFGGSAKSDKAKKNPIKLKPKLQWDRYSALKTAKRVKVGIRLVDEETSEWLSVGKVKSKEDGLIAAAVAMQRGIIAEVRRSSRGGRGDWRRLNFFLVVINETVAWQTAVSFASFEEIYM